MSKGALKFDVQKWRDSADVRSCAPLARAVWLEMLCVMAEAEPFGFFLIDGKKVGPGRFAQVANMTVEDVQSGIAQLEKAGVFSRDGEGRIYCRKMARDARFGAAQSARAKARWSKEKTGKTKALTKSGIAGSKGRAAANPAMPDPLGNAEKKSGNAIHRRSPLTAETENKIKKSSSSTKTKKVDASPPARPAVGTRLPVAWFADETDRGYARERSFTEDEINDTEEDFRDFWIAKPGRDGRKLDWRATWRRWVREQGKRNGRNRNRAEQAGAQRRDNIVRAFATPAAKAGPGRGG